MQKARHFLIFAFNLNPTKTTINNENKNKNNAVRNIMKTHIQALEKLNFTIEILTCNYFKVIKQGLTLFL